LTDPECPVAQQLCHLLSEEERKALLARLKQLIRNASYPAPQSHRRNYPWPPV
jgi:hypothetical protein